MDYISICNTAQRPLPSYPTMEKHHEIKTQLAWVARDTHNREFVRKSHGERPLGRT